MIIDETQIDWEQLRDQKLTLLELREDFYGYQTIQRGLLADSEVGSEVASIIDKRIDAMSGIIHLLDYIQDTAVDGGYVPEKEVFNFDEDEAAQ